MKLKLFVEHVILSESANGKTKQLVLYLNARTPYEYEYYVNTTNGKGSGGGIVMIILTMPCRTIIK